MIKPISARHALKGSIRKVHLDMLLSYLILFIVMYVVVLNTHSLGRAEYFVTFIDNYSHYSYLGFHAQEQGWSLWVISTVESTSGKKEARGESVTYQ